MNDDLISRRGAVDALWKALYEYEDKTEKQFQEHEELDIGDWILYRIFVQNMNDIDRQIILDMPLAEPRWIPCGERLPKKGTKAILLYSNGKISGGCYLGERTWDIDYADIDLSVSVAAWMRCPDPYIGDNE